MKESALSSYQQQREKEDEESRFHYHRMLHAFAERGDFVNCEAVMKQMNESNHLPGPKAFHALVLAYVKGGYAKGALGAIRTEVGKGIRPLPQTYAAVVLAFLREGDVDTAQAVYASNMRAEGVPVEQSWRILTGAMFSRAADSEAYYQNAMDLLQQGEAEGLTPDRPMYERMVEAMCREGDVESARDRLVQMKNQGFVVEKKVLSSVVTGFALAGRIDEAERGLLAMVRAPGVIEAGVIGAINAVLLSYLREEDMGKEELAERISWVRGQMLVGGLSLDRKGVSLLLSASVLLEDVNVGKLAFDALWGQPATSGTRLMYVTDECLAKFLHELSLAGDVESIDRCLDLIVSEGREIPEAADELAGGRTFLTAWIEAAGEESKTQQVYIDGVGLDDQTLCVTDDAGNPIPVTKMTVKQLRAELSLRNQETRGNKAVLIKTLKKARVAAAEGGSAGSEPADNKKKIDVIVSNVTWNAGTVMQRRSEESKQIAEEDEEGADIDDESDTVDDVDDELLLSMDDSDDEDTFEYDDRVSSIIRLRNATSRRGSDDLDASDPLRCTLALANKAKLAGFRPTAEDIEFLRGLDESSESDELRHLGQLVQN